MSTETLTVQAPLPYDEAIVSWNVANPEHSNLQVEVRPSGEGKWYTLAQWSSASPRQSVNGQSDSECSILTDTIRLKDWASALDIRLTYKTEDGAQNPKLKLLTVAFSNGAPQPDTAPTKSLAYGQNLDVPQKAQGDYPRGEVVCSPTSLSMVLDYWAKQKGRPDWARDVPEVDAGVYDTAYNGSGNWAFNAAYAGTLDGMTAYVTRLAGIADLETLVQSKIPVICSAPHSLLQGRELGKGEEGHLVVVVGFTKEGDLIVNDPAHRAELQKIYSRENFDRAWRSSKRAVYLVYPDGTPMPEGSARWLHS